MCDVSWLVIVGLVALCLLGCKWYMECGGETNRILWFYRDQCGYCKQMEGEWERFANMAPKHVELKKINTADPANQQMARDYGVQGVPHIVKESRGQKVVYKGPRKAADFLKWSIN